MKAILVIWITLGALSAVFGYDTVYQNELTIQQIREHKTYQFQFLRALPEEGLEPYVIVIKNRDPKDFQELADKSFFKFVIYETKKKEKVVGVFTLRKHVTESTIVAHYTVEEPLIESYRPNIDLIDLFQADSIFSVVL